MRLRGSPHRNYRRQGIPPRVICHHLLRMSSPGAPAPTPRPRALPDTAFPVRTCRTCRIPRRRRVLRHVSLRLARPAPSAASARCTHCWRPALPAAPEPEPPPRSPVPAAQPVVPRARRRDQPQARKSPAIQAWSSQVGARHGSSRRRARRQLAVGSTSCSKRWRNYLSAGLVRTLRSFVRLQDTSAAIRRLMPWQL